MHVALDLNPHFAARTETSYRGGLAIKVLRKLSPRSCKRIEEKPLNGQYLAVVERGLYSTVGSRRKVSSGLSRNIADKKNLNGIIDSWTQTYSISILDTLYFFK